MRGRGGREGGRDRDRGRQIRKKTDREEGGSNDRDREGESERV